VPTFTVPAAAGIGVGQKWLDVKNNRASEKTYTNDSGKPIMVSVSFYLPHDRSALVYVDSIKILGQGSPADDSWHTLTFVVPVGSTYRIDQNGWQLDIWAELR
jgi:hypothetical protein